ncbi:pentapeptide repeat-containing protein [Lyngbya sp. CCY1209]|uniref:pentapeptide repeat-containing protein n=1 Tax=Lyngbya sp. CCY1209 TaxID=2886103 RepID=UPI002D204153|nr:pentapeptide repeat-containing protein [Lyngbya sp. CCY1209]MEB3886142.1 pentapeptide repeat-containing protein [Lyngbya sp. CCY1209]
MSLKPGELLQGVAKGGIAVIFQNWENAGASAVDILKSLDINPNEPSAIAWLLVQRSLIGAMLELVKERSLQTELDPQELRQTLDRELENHQELPRTFFDRPKDLDLLDAVRQPYQSWLESQGFEPTHSANLAKRLPSYFVFALHREWRSNPATYAILTKELDTPFAEAIDRELAWKHYLIWLQRRVNEPMFEESFGLADVYIPLRGYYEKKSSESREPENLKSPKKERVAIDLHETLTNWVKRADKEDAIRVICGGPGSGKSSFCKMFAAKLAQDETTRILFIPLHHLKIRDALQDAVQDFIDTDLDNLLPPNPLTKEHQESQVLLIFDGLDELAMQGKAAFQVAQDFITEVQSNLNRYNQTEAKILVLMSGRDIVVQHNQTYFRKEGQILHLLPYSLKSEKEWGISYIDEQQLLTTDLRQVWWKKYGELKGKVYQGLPPELDRGKLAEITAQPLLNYLIALSYDRQRLDFSETNNLNSIYSDLLDRVFERDWENYRHPTLNAIDKKDFIRILEEIAIACWHGNRRTATIAQIENRCNSKLQKLLEVMRCNDSQSGVTQLLTAFYFRQSEQYASDATFEFTHKTFGEYLAACRIVLQLKNTHEEFHRKQDDPDKGWDEKHCLSEWAKLCGPSEVDQYLLTFLRDEMALQDPEEVKQWQQTLCQLIDYMLRKGMPMEKLDPRPSYFEESYQARNAEEALLAALSSCAYVTEIVSNIKCFQQQPDAFGNWLSKLQGQRTSSKNRTALMCLNHLNLSGAILLIKDLYNSNFTNTNIEYAELRIANLGGANLEGANLKNAALRSANLENANLTNANLEKTELSGTKLMFAKLGNANLRSANLEFADLRNANLKGADFTDARLYRTNFRDANLSYANFRNADLRNANLTDARKYHANFQDAILPENFNP